MPAITSSIMMVYPVCPKSGNQRSDIPCYTCGTTLWKLWKQRDNGMRSPEKMYCKNGCEIVIGEVFHE
jgi:hypothetical protein